MQDWTVRHEQHERLDGLLQQLLDGCSEPSLGDIDDIDRLQPMAFPSCGGLVSDQDARRSELRKCRGDDTEQARTGGRESSSSLVAPVSELRDGGKDAIPSFGPYAAPHNRGCSWGRKPPVSSSDLAM
jgi:hypothetical protein